MRNETEEVKGVVERVTYSRFKGRPLRTEQIEVEDSQTWSILKIVTFLLF